MRRVRHSASLVAVLVLVAAVCTSGCNFFKTDKTRLLSPEKVISAPGRSPINPILPSVGLVDQAQELVPNATFPTEGDWEYSDADYVIGPTDVLDISILDVLQEGLETILRRQVSSSGFIDLPLLEDRVKASGLTKEQLKETITQAYNPDILRDPVVSITIAAQRQSTFSILGAVAQPGTYNIVRKDMRLLETLALAGGVTQTNIRYL
ncbi:MAG: polysaccharide biosynthesis/export family protein, partial [Planctomycetota bacterium]|nr:polysaccharide biosynthesis/export family protein [Planctomycetota bacterium]